jgi:hypothetical protein
LLPEPHEGYADVALRYPSGLGVMFSSTGTYYGVAPIPHGEEQFWVQGPDGILDWRVGGPVTVSTRSSGP